MRRRPQVPAAPPVAEMPRDVEAVEQVIAALDGVSDRTTAFRTVAATLVKALGLGYGAVWLSDGDGVFHLVGQSGPLADALAAFPDQRECGRNLWTTAHRFSRWTAAAGHARHEDTTECAHRGL